jgi:hypothetical protein
MLFCLSSFCLIYLPFLTQVRSTGACSRNITTQPFSLPYSLFFYDFAIRCSDSMRYFVFSLNTFCLTNTCINMKKQCTIKIICLIKLTFKMHVYDQFIQNKSKSVCWKMFFYCFSLYKWNSERTGSVNIHSGRKKKVIFLWRLRICVLYHNAARPVICEVRHFI